MSDEPLQLWVRTSKGQVYGPLAPVSVELLIDNGAIEGRVQVSTDGVSYVSPGRLPGVRMFFPEELWGDAVAPDDGSDASLGSPVVSPVLGIPSEPAASPAPRAGAGAAPRNPPVLVPGPSALPPTVRAAASGGGASQAPGRAPAAPPRPATPASPGPRAAERPEPSTPAGAVAGLPIPASGSLAERSPVALYFAAASAGLTGLLRLVLADRALSVHFRKGNPEFLDSSHPSDGLSAFLVERKLVTAAQLEQAEAAKGRFGGELVPTLMGLGLLNPSTGFSELAGRATAILRSALLAEEGRFEWSPVDLPASRVTPLGNRWALFIEQLRTAGIPEVKRRLAGVASLPVVRSGDGSFSVSELRFTPQETRALSRFDGTASLEQLAAAHVSEAQALYRVAWILRECGLVVFPGVGGKGPPAERAQPGARATAPVAGEAKVPPVVGLGPRASAPVAGEAKAPPVVGLGPRAGAPVAGEAKAPPPAAGPRPGPGAPPILGGPPQGPATSPSGVRAASGPAGSSSSGVREVPADIAALKARAEAMKKQTHFEVLGLAAGADAAAVKAAYLKLARLYHPDARPPGAPEEYGAVTAQIFSRITEASRTLSDAKARASYEAELQAGGAGEKVDVATLFAAEDAFHKGRAHVRARKFAEAVRLLDEAIKANPDEPEFYAWRGYARFFAAADPKKVRAEAERDLATCLSKNPSVAVAYYFQGHLAKVLGEHKTAKAKFQKCVELDPKHIDAQRELRLMK